MLGIDWQSISQNQEPPAGWPRYPKFNEPGDVPGPPVQYGEPLTNANVKAGFNFIPNGVEEKNIYYYHPDHLGSSSYITDKNGEVIQHTEYMAFGEVLVDEHSTSNKMPYLFNGKELDYETGLYYYGARYYDPKTSIFLNVDPLVEKTGTPYAYTYNNPINLIDPTGMEAMRPPEDSGGYEVGQVYSDNEGSWTRMIGRWDNNDKNGVSYIDAVTLVGKQKPKNGFSKSTNSIYVKDNTFGAHIVSLDYNRYGEYGEFKSNISIVSGEITNHTFTGALPLAMYIEAETSVISGKAGGILGSQDYNLYGDASGTFLGASGNLTMGILSGENSKYGVAASGGVNASVLDGKVNGGVTIFGVRMGGEVNGCLACAKAEYNTEIYYDNKAGRLRVSLGIAAGLGLGAGLKGNLDIPIK